MILNASVVICELCLTVFWLLFMRLDLVLKESEVTAVDSTFNFIAISELH